MDDEIRPTKRSRVLVACLRCKRRRQKCDNAAPACSNCARSNATCTYPNYPTTYVNQLEEKVGLLEARLRSADPQRASDSNITRDESQPQILSPSSISSHQQQSPAMAAPSGHLASGIGVLSSCAAAEPHYFGFSSGLTLAHFVEAAIAPDNGASQINLPSLADRPFSKQVPTAQTPLAPIPTHSAGSKYIKAYLSNVHPLYPFIDEDELWRIQHDITGESQSSVNSQSQTRADLARLHLIYAIGSRCVQLLRPRKIEKQLPEGHLMSAMQHIGEVLKYTSIHTVEITLLLAIHSMRSPSGASVWHLCGFAMRQCLELGLHRPKPSQTSQARLEQQRRKLFWSVYIFERKSALVLGRPFAISDKDIETPMPEDHNDGRNLALHRHYILLYQIHSKIRSTLHRLKQDGSNEVIEKKVDTCLQRLEDWKESVLQEVASRTNDSISDTTSTTMPPQNDSSDSGDEEVTSVTAIGRSPTLDKTELLLEYHKARRSLLQPLLTEAGQYSPTLADYEACADASGQICQHYRQLHRLSALPFTLRDLHAVVIAGFTSIYCIMVRPSLYNARRASEVGACSTVLYVIAEQWKSARRYRDAFEAVADRLAELVSGTQLERQHEPTNVNGKASASDARIPRQSCSAEPLSGTSMASSGMLPLETQSTMPALFDQGDSDMDGLLSTLFEDSFPNFDLNYGDGELRGLLANEGLDWFSSNR